jgi:hypothetical protein
LIFLAIIACDTAPRQGIIFESHPNEKDPAFKPTNAQIDKAENKLKAYLLEKTKSNETIYENVFSEKIPLEERLKFYNRRYFGRVNIEDEQVILIEFVFVRCGGSEEWKKIEYAREDNKECWWSVQYNIDRDEIYDLRK